MMVKVRALLDGVIHPDLSSLIGTFDVKIAEAVIQKQLSMLAAVAHEYVAHLQQLHPCFKDCVSPWGSTLPPASNAVSSNQVSNPPMWEYDRMGRITNAAHLITTMGFEIGSCVFKKIDTTVSGRIVSITNDAVSVLLDTGVSSDVPTPQFLNKEWSVTLTKQAPEMVVEWLKFQPTVSPDFNVVGAKAFVSVTLTDLTFSHVEHLSSLEIQAKPGKSVIVTDSIPKGKLVLVPSTTKIESGSTFKRPEQALFQVGCIAGVKYWLTPHVSLPGTKATPFVCPAWFVETSDDDAVVNMELKRLGPFGDRYKIYIPVLRNLKVLAAGDKLVMKKFDSSFAELEDSATSVAPKAPKSKAKAKADAAGGAEGSKRRKRD